MVKNELLGSVPPIVPGLAQVWPRSREEFRLGHAVVEVTVSGAVPDARVEVIWPEAERVVTEVFAPVTVSPS